MIDQRESNLYAVFQILINANAEYILKSKAIGREIPKQRICMNTAKGSIVVMFDEKKTAFLIGKSSANMETKLARFKNMSRVIESLPGRFSSCFSVYAILLEAVDIKIICKEA